MLRNLLMRKKVFEAEVEIDEFFKENEIEDSESRIIQSLVFDKSVFKTAAEAKEWAADHGFYSGTVDEMENSFVIRQYDPMQFDPETFVTIEVRRGIKVIIGAIKAVKVGENESVLAFSLKSSDQIEFSEGIPYIIKVCKVVDGFHPRYGKVSIKTEDLKSMVKNFRDGIVGVDLAINRDHEKIEAYGWLKDVWLSNDEQTLFGQVVWCANGVTALAEKTFRYFSPEFQFNYEHPHTGVSYGPTLMGGALTNYPFLKMEPITNLSNKNGGNQMSTIALSDHQKTVLELNEKIVAAQNETKSFSEKVTKLESEKIELSNKISQMEAEKAKADKISAHQKLFDAGKINAAQLTALNEGKNFLEILSLSEGMNTSPNGKEVSGNQTVQLSADEKAMCAALNLTEAEYIAANK